LPARWAGGASRALCARGRSAVVPAE